MHKITMLAFAFAIAANAASAAPASADVTISPSGRVASKALTLQQPVRAVAHRTAGSVVFSNIAWLNPNGLYMAGSADDFGYANSQVPNESIAAAFTAPTTTTVTEIDVPVGTIWGNRAVGDVHLYADAGGVPGTELWTHSVAMEPDGACCTIASVLLKTGGVKLTAGTQYWIGMSGSKGAPGALGAWYYNVSDQVDAGLMAFNRNNGTGWTTSSSQPFVAFAVYGK